MFVPQNEMGVLVLFSTQCEKLGIEVIRVGSAFPDMTVCYKGMTYEVEIEYRASNFISHGHDPLGCDLILCWQNDLLLPPVPVLEISDTNWHKSQWGIMTRKDKEVRALYSEIFKLREELRDAKKTIRGWSEEDFHKRMNIGKAAKVEARQSELLKILIAEFDGADIAALNKTELGERLGATRQTIGKDLDALNVAGKIALNGHVTVK